MDLIQEIFQPSNYSNWNLIVQFGLVSLMLVLGNLVRRRVKFLRNMLFPTAIIAGFIGLGLKYLIFGLDLRIDNQLILDQGFLDAVTYHALALGFVAMGLKSVKKADNTMKGKPVKTGLVIVNTYLLQGVVGLLITFFLAFIFPDLATYAGLLLPMGYGQGPGQAGNIGGIFEGQGFIGGRSFGLAIAMFGILWACVAGILYINKRSKEGKIKRAAEEVAVATKSDEVETVDEIPLSDAIDKFSVQIIFVAVVYFFAYLFMKGITSLLGLILENPVSVTGLIWGFNFIFAMLFAILFKVILNALKKKNIIKRKYTNEYMLDRVAGLVFDFMIVCSIMAIDMSVIFNTEGLFPSLLIITTIGGFITFFYLKIIIKRVYPEYEHQAFASLWGNLAGTASNGIALLREIDPKFETPAADDLVSGSSTAVVFGAPLLAITALVYQGPWYFWGSVVVMTIIFVLYSFLMFKSPFKKKRQKPMDHKGNKSTK